jgi:hypothetical protein
VCGWRVDLFFNVVADVSMVMVSSQLVLYIPRLTTVAVIALCCGVSPILPFIQVC